jgi:hypothetical protein
MHGDFAIHPAWKDDVAGGHAYALANDARSFEFFRALMRRYDLQPFHDKIV